MTKFILRTTLITIIVCYTALISKAQIGFDYAQYDLGTSVAFNQFYGDVVTPKSTKAINFNFNYNQTPFINYILELQIGKLAGGDAQKDYYGRQFAADYTSYSFRVQVQAGEVIDYSQSKLANAFKNLYLSTGLGMIYSNITSNNRFSIQDPGFYSPGIDKSNQVFIPARIGYEIKIFNKYQEPSCRIDLGYQYDFVLGDQLDGFKAGNHDDIIGQFTLGIKFAIAGVTSYRKQIHY